MISIITHNNLPAVKISNDSADALIYLFGGHVASFIPKGQKDVIWVSEKSLFDKSKAIRGGIPICWPWFGFPQGKNLPPTATTQHGMIRTQDWSLEDACEPDSNTSIVTLSITDSPVTHAIWNYKFKLSLKVTVSDSLKIELTTENRDDKSFEIRQALHTYFAVGDITKTSVVGFDKQAYTDEVPNAPIYENVQCGDITFSSETDRIYHNFSGNSSIVDKANSRIINIKKSNSNTSVVWNPWIDKSIRMPDFGDDEYKTMLCIESCNICEDTKTIAPKESFTISSEYSVTNI